MKEESFGILPLKKEQGNWTIFLIKSRSGGYWGFPKGKSNPGETAQASATRELKEETGLDLDRFLTDEPLIEDYEYSFKGRRISKTVTYFPALVKGSIRLQTEEVIAGKWVPLDQAAVQLTYPESQRLLQILIEILQNVH